MKRFLTVLALSAAALISPAPEAGAVTVSVDLTGALYDMSYTGPTGNGNQIRTDSYTQMAAFSFSTSGGALELFAPSGSTGTGGFLDPFLYLFEDDGDFSQDDLITYNDDVFFPLSLDSYISATVPGGNYIALLGQYTWRRGGGAPWTRPGPEAYIDYVTGIVGGAAYQDVAGWNTMPQNGTVEASYNYELTITGEDLVLAGVPAVPLPASAPLLLAALLLPAGLRKLQRRS